MRKLLLLNLLLSLSFISKSQSLTFDETVSYINEVLVENKSLFWKYNVNAGYYIGQITAKKDGRVVFYGLNKTIIGSVNLKDVYNFECNDHWLKFNLKEKERYSNYSDDLRHKYIGYIDELKGGSCERVKKAFIHLASLCTDKDPFGD